MSSISSGNPYAAMYQAFETGGFDKDTPRHNPLDHTAGDDAETFDPTTQSWQPTQATGRGQFAPLGTPYREAIDFEIKSDGNGGWQRA
ncbi:hypothetical protein [Pseudomonas poae]|nr:hypothetical protein [Pseudomonas poae]